MRRLPKNKKCPKSDDPQHEEKIVNHKNIPFLDFNDAKKKYEEIEIPEELPFVLSRAIAAQKNKRPTFFRRHPWTRPLITVGISFCMIFAILLNTNEIFAQSVYDIPVIGDVAKFLTVREYHSESDTDLLNAKLPILTNTGNSKLEKRINEEIQGKIDAIVADAQHQAKQYKEDLIKQNGNADVFLPMDINVNYKVKFANETTLSFVITVSEGFVSYTEQQFFYNINLKNGNALTLSELLGPNYIQIANASIKSQMDYRQTHEGAVYFQPDDDVPEDESFHSIQADQNFYINEKGHVVIVFDKYEIAPGSMGIQEFEIPQDTCLSKK